MSAPPMRPMSGAADAARCPARRMPAADVGPADGAAPSGYPRFDDTDRRRPARTSAATRRPPRAHGHDPRDALRPRRLDGARLGGPPTRRELQRIDAMRRTFTARRFGSGYDAMQVNRLFDAIIASLSGRSGMPVNESELDPNQFSLVPGGYFEAEVNQALREVRDTRPPLPALTSAEPRRPPLATRHGSLRARRRRPCGSGAGSAQAVAAQDEVDRRAISSEQRRRCRQEDRSRRCPRGCRRTPSASSAMIVTTAPNRASRRLTVGGAGRVRSLPRVPATSPRHVRVLVARSTAVPVSRSVWHAGPVQSGQVDRTW